jgi:hypothetical protein
MDWRNLVSLLRVGKFFFPATGEIAVISGLYSYSTADIFTTLCLNGKVMLESIFTYGSDYHSIFPTYRAADYRFPLINPSVLPFVLGGLVISLASIKKRTVLLAMPWMSVLVLLIICLLPPMFSSVFVNHPSLPKGLLGTLSNHRLYYLLFPLYLLVAASVHWILANNKLRRFAPVPLTAAIVLIFSWSVYGLVKENSRFEAKLAAIDPTLHGPSSYIQWRDGAPNLDRSDVHSSHFQQHAQYYLAAKEIMSLVRGRPLLILADANSFTESPLKPYTITYINELNYHAPYLALYLNDDGLDTAWVLMLDKNRTPVQLGFSRPREYSAPMTMDEKTGLGYQNEKGLVGVVQYFGPNARPAAILATTPEEAETARRWFDGHGMNYRIVELKSLKSIQ